MLFFVRSDVDKVKRMPILVLGGAADWSIRHADVTNTASLYGCRDHQLRRAVP
jgi:hypothetical protein